MTFVPKNHIDTHLHLDDKIPGASPEICAKELNRQLEESNVSHAVVLQLEAQGWSLEAVAEGCRPYPRLKLFANVHPYAPDAIERFDFATKKLGYIGLKLHPRLQDFNIDDERVAHFIQKIGERGYPVLIDAFPDGTHLMMDFSPLQFANLAKKCPQTKIIWAHFGGHYAIDFMMLAKRLPNVYLDCSYSLLYYQGSSVPNDIFYCMRSMKFQRVFYGSDYPDRTIKDTLTRSIDFMNSAGISQPELDALCWKNASDFFNWGMK